MLFRDALEKSCHFNACIFCPTLDSPPLHLTQAGQDFFSPQKHSHNQTCLSSLTVILQHRNREWTWSLHTHGQSQVVRLRMPVFDLCLHHSNPRKTHLNITPPLLDTWSSSGAPYPVHSHQESLEGPLKTQTGVPFHFTVKMYDSLGKSGFPGSLTLLTSPTLFLHNPHGRSRCKKYRKG